jgi:chemotaxis receptor (MCP) glutamine deamidase CheD
MDIGARNEASTRAALKAARIPVVAAETSGSTGRTIRVDVQEATVLVKAAGGKPMTLFGG